MIDSDEIKVKTSVDANRRHTTRDVQDILNVSKIERGKLFKGTLTRK